jgi:16S rRNA processing protein RimM
VPKPERLVVGRIEKAHGIRGEVSVMVLTDITERFDPGSVLGAGDHLHADRTLTVESSRRHHERLLVRFAEASDRAAAEGLRGLTLTIPAEEAAQLGEWTFYPFQLEGLDVVDLAGTSLGVMRRVDEGAASDYWVVRAKGQDVLVPAVRDIVKAVDLDNGKIVLDPPEGLFE